ncbi:hypothetical protein [Anaeromassilibacillus senegalensis]|uniref:hypothetical protein n=1 Tax=Anaeromassilibacillus senegalensis TaxID=1673717 RepID=UPI000682DA4F|nr:hypothetical protein [Anaeromassilibacillus senegalensis]
METEKILEQFALMAELDERRADKYRSFCDQAKEQLEALAKPGESYAAARALEAAAAALAFYRWSLFRTAVGVETGFAAGEVRVTKSGTDVAMARQLWREAEAAAAPYLRDEGFVFERI